MRVATFILIILSAVACTAPGPSVPAEVGTLDVTVLAGPVCPVETQPPDPACEPRPVAGAQLFVSPGDGTDIVVSQATTDENGFARFELPTGTYIVTGSEVAGFFGIPDPAMADVLGGDTAPLTLSYDTGIR